MRFVQALIVPAEGAAPELAELRLPETGPRRVRVRIRAAGVCHTDLSMATGVLKVPHPLVLGHEAAGEVVETGAGVTRVREGDHVALNWSPPCDECFFCARGEPWLCDSGTLPARENGTTLDGTPVSTALGLGAFAQEVVVPERALIPVPSALAWENAALLGCAVMTGSGAVRNTAAVRAGESVLVIGLGGVGLSVVAAARAAGADPVIAVDVAESKRELAAAAGATTFLADPSPARAVRGMTDGRGVDHAFECVGRAATIRAAWRSTRRGGAVTVVGMGRGDDLLELSALDIFTSARTLRSSVYGSSVPDREVPQLARAVLDGSLALDHLITDRITLAGIPDAFARMGRGEGARSLVLLS
jgi:S-(hydroxymethyl)glutathione dehydrogenase / alcohol dehydrogenase